MSAVVRWVRARQGGPCLRFHGGLRTPPVLIKASPPHLHIKSVPSPHPRPGFWVLPVGWPPPLSATDAFGLTCPSHGACVINSFLLQLPHSWL